MNLITLMLLTAAAASAQTPEVEVWAQSALQKVRPDDPARPSNLVWDKATRTITVAGAKNEHIPFQVIVSTPPPPNRYHKAASGFFVEASELVSGNGRIPKDRIKLYLEHVVLCYAKSSPAGETGFWPDALAPQIGRAHV